MADPENCFIDVKKGVIADNRDIEFSETDARTLTRMYSCGEILVYKPHRCEERRELNQE
jgi:hypothetical protein